MVNAAKPIKHGRRVWWWWEGGAESRVPQRAALCGLLSCCSVSLVCVWPSNGTRPYKRTSLVFCTLLYECLALFLVHPPGASQQNTLFQTNSRQTQTLHSIMTSGEHSNGVAPVSELNLERWGIKERGHGWEQKRAELLGGAGGAVGRHEQGRQKTSGSILKTFSRKNIERNTLLTSNIGLFLQDSCNFLYLNIFLCKLGVNDTNVLCSWHKLPQLLKVKTL